VSTPTAPPARRGSPVGRVVVIVLIVAIAAFWLYAFLWPREAKDKIPDGAWTEQAELVCQRWQDEVNALPPANDFLDVEPREEALRQRADVGEQATAYLRSMVAELQTLPAPTDADSADKLELWFADWDAYLEARDVHVAEWRAGQDVRFREPPVREGGLSPISLRMDAFAGTNGMPTCRVPQDFG
jgi:hypothetical protein